MFATLRHMWSNVVVSDEQLSEYFDKDPWGLACAHMAYWRTDGLTMGFEIWWWLAADNFMLKAREAFPLITTARIKSFLRHTSERNKGLSYVEVMEAASRRSGTPVGLVLGPGESASIEATMRIGQITELDDCIVTKHPAR